MRKHTERASEIQAGRQHKPDPAPESGTRQPAPSDATGEAGHPTVAEQAPVVAESLLHDGHLAGRGTGQLLQTALQAMQRTYGNRAVQRFIGRSPGAGAPSARPIQRAWPDAAKSGATTNQPGVQAPRGGSWNADDTVTIGTIRRIPVAGLKSTGVDDDADVGAYQEPEGGQVRDHTDEPDVTRASKGHPSTGQAIVLVPEPLGVPQGGQVDVLLHLHGHGIGFRQRKKDRIGNDGTPVAGMEAGTVRDVDLDRIPQQLETTIKNSKRPIVAVLPQGGYKSDFGALAGDAYLADVFSKVSALAGVTPGRVVLSGHSGGGDAIVHMMDAKRLPKNLAELVLFDALNVDSEIDSIVDWVREQVKNDLKAITGKTDADQLTYLQGGDSKRFRGFHSQQVKSNKYAKRFDTLRTNLQAAIAEEVKHSKLTLSATVLKQLRSNYDAEDSRDMLVNTPHEGIMGAGSFETALKALPPPPATGTATVPQRPAVPAQPLAAQRTPAAVGVDRAPATPVQRDHRRGSHPALPSFTLSGLRFTVDGNIVKPRAGDGGWTFTPVTPAAPGTTTGSGSGAGSGSGSATALAPLEFEATRMLPGSHYIATGGADTPFGERARVTVTGNSATVTTPVAQLPATGAPQATVTLNAREEGATQDVAVGSVSTDELQVRLSGLAPHDADTIRIKTAHGAQAAYVFSTLTPAPGTTVRGFFSIGNQTTYRGTPGIAGDYLTKAPFESTFDHLVATHQVGADIAAEKAIYSATNEIEGTFDTVQTYDSGVLTFGFGQWTANASLPQMLTAVPDDVFNRYLGQYGLGRGTPALGTEAQMNRVAPPAAVRRANDSADLALHMPAEGSLTLGGKELLSGNAYAFAQTWAGKLAAYAQELPALKADAAGADHAKATHAAGLIDACWTELAGLPGVPARAPRGTTAEQKADKLLAAVTAAKTAADSVVTGAQSIEAIRTSEWVLRFQIFGRDPEVEKAELVHSHKTIDDLKKRTAGTGVPYGTLLRGDRALAVLFTTFLNNPSRVRNGLVEAIPTFRAAQVAAAAKAAQTAAQKLTQLSGAHAGAAEITAATTAKEDAEKAQTAWAAFPWPANDPRWATYYTAAAAEQFEATAEPRMLHGTTDPKRRADIMEHRFPRTAVQPMRAGAAHAPAGPARAVQRQPATDLPQVETPPPPTHEQIAGALITATVDAATKGETLLHADDVQRALAGRAADAHLTEVFDKAVERIAQTTTSTVALTMYARWEVKPVLRALEFAFIHDPAASTLDLLPPDRAHHYRNFRWHRLDYPGRSRDATTRELDPAGPHEDEAAAMMAELGRVLPEHRANIGDAAVVREDEFNARMQAYVVQELVPVPGQTAFQLNRHAAADFDAMQKAAARDGVDLSINNSWRSYATAQANAQRSGNSQAVATFSSHTLGLAIDFNLSVGRQQYEEVTTRPMQNVADMHQSPVHKWLFLNAAQFGWYPWHNEPWHWEYNPSGFRDTFRDNLRNARH